MNNFFLLGTDGKEYEVIMLIDVRTNLPLDGHPFALVAKKVIEAGAFSTNDILSLSDSRANGMKEAVVEQINKNPNFLKSLRQITFHPTA